jgi:aryl-alcohol dehydrogenase-like predicted oxidoreductase
MEGPPEGTRVEAAEEHGWSESWSAYNTEHTWNVLGELFAIAEELEKSPAQVALNWLLQRPGVTGPIIGASKMSHLEDNLGAAGWALSGEHMDRLNKVSDVEAPYPYWMIEGANQDR